MRRFSLTVASIMALAIGCGGGSAGGGGGNPTYAISGTIHGASGVTVALSGAATASTTTDASGKYKFAQLAGGTYTVTPSLAGYVFSPMNLSVTVSGADVAGKDFTATANANPHAISGTVSGLAAGGVTISLTGDNTATTTTDGSGHYSFSGLADGSYTVTPSLTSYVFTPASASVTLSGADATGKDFTDTGAYGISGTVSGLVASSVNVTLTGAVSGSTTTDGSGHYSFTGLPNGTYTVTPSLAGGYAFAPASKSVTVSGAVQTGQDFTDTGAYAISGTVSGRTVAGVTVSLSGGATATTTTDASGNYSFTGLIGGSYTVTPSLAGGYAFSPSSRVVGVGSASVTGQDFSDAGKWAISGKVSGLVKSGVTVALGGTSTATTTTDGSGNYAFTQLIDGSYTVTPSLAGGYAFAPASAPITVNGADATGRNFTSTGAYSISGTVAGVVPGGVTMTLTGGASATTTTSGSGSYTFGGLPNGQYTVTPSLPGYTFSPVNTPVTVGGADATAVNFTDSGTAYTISGHVSGASVPITVRLGGASSATTSTDGSGNYSFGHLANGLTYTVTPSMVGYSFTPSSDTVTIALADATRDFAVQGSPMPGNAFLTFTGQVSYSGSSTGRIFVTVGWQNWGGDPAAGTSLAAPGSFTIHGIQGPGQLPATAVVTVWRDTLGIGKIDLAVDPFLTKTVSVDGASNPMDLGTLTLDDPSPAAPIAPAEQGVLPSDSAALVIFKPPTDDQRHLLADHYKVYWSTTANPGPANHLGTPLTVPAGSDFGIVYDLTNGTSYYFGVSSVANGVESDVTSFTKSGAVPIGQYVPAASHDITGTVTFPNLGATSSVFIVAQTGHDGPISATRVAVSGSATSSTYTLPVVDGTYGLLAFVDRGNKGFVGNTDPAMFGMEVPAAWVTVQGSAASAPTFGIPTGNAVATVTTDHSDYGGGSTNDRLNFSVTSNLKFPVSAQITQGPNLVLPVDMAISTRDNPTFSFETGLSLYPASPQVGDSYAVHVVYSDGTFEDLTASVTGYLTSLPVLVSPANGATGVGATPTFTWTAPSSPPTDAYYYRIEVYPRTGGGNGWWYGPMPSSTTSVQYDLDGSASPLQSGVDYQWRLYLLDSHGNYEMKQADFTD